MPEDEYIDRMTTNALRLLDAGVTTARDLGCPGTYSITLCDQINAGEKMGPRMLVANGELAYAQLLFHTRPRALTMA